MLEVASEPLDESPATFVQRNELANLTKTGDVTVACRDELVRSKLQQESTAELQVSFEVLDFSQKLPDGANQDKSYDVAIASVLATSPPTPELLIKNLHKVLKNEGGFVFW